MAKFSLAEKITEAGSPVKYNAVMHIHRITAGKPADPKAFETLVRLQVTKGAPGTAQYEQEVQKRLDEQTETQGSGILDEVPDELEKAARDFPRINGQPHMRGFQVKACMREAFSTLTGPGTPGYFSGVIHLKNGVTVDPDFIPIEVSGQEKIQRLYSAGHVMGPRGERSILKVSEVIEEATAHFTVTVLPGVPQEYFTEDAVKKLLEQGQLIGIGSDRSLGSGRWTLVSFTKIV